MPYKNPEDRRRYYAQHVQEKRAKGRAYYHANIDRRRETARESYWKNADVIHAREYQWKLDHPGQPTKAQRYEARIRKAGTRRRHGYAVFFEYRHPGYTLEKIRVGPLGDVTSHLNQTSLRAIKTQHAHTKVWNLRNRERERYKRIERAYGITKEQYMEMAKRQDGKCAICKTDVAIDLFAVDHNHITQAVRGLLCDPCNLLLGRYERHGDAMRDYLQSCP